IVEIMFNKTNQQTRGIGREKNPKGARMLATMASYGIGPSNPRQQDRSDQMSQSSYSEKSLRSNNGIEEMCRDRCNWAIKGMIPHQTQYNCKAKSNKLHYFSLSRRFIIILDLSVPSIFQSDLNVKATVAPLYFLATNHFTDMGCERASKLVSSGVQKPKSYAAPVGDPGIGLEQLELMCKLYGDEQASSIKVKTFNIEGNSYLSRKKKSGQKKKK
ncbi:hypothetical protein HID58_045523, partial [Brassica napus]